jgi:hypothetical protein
MTSKKLGSLLRSAPPATVRSEAPDVLPRGGSNPVEEDAPALLARGKEAIGIEPEVPLQVLVPASIRKQLAFKAAEEGQSLRALVLRAIRSLGIEVSDAQIRGKRGRRNL